MNAVPTGVDIGSAGLIVVGNATIGSPGVETKTTKRVRSKDASPSTRKKTCVVCEFKKMPGCDKGKRDRKKCPHYNKDDEDGINRAMKDKKNAARKAVAKAKKAKKRDFLLKFWISVTNLTSFKTLSRGIFFIAVVFKA